MDAAQNPTSSKPLFLFLAERLFKQARPDQNLERGKLAGYIHSVLGYTLIIIPQVVTNMMDEDGRQFGWHRAGTLFGAVDPQGVVYEGCDSTVGASGGRWDANFTRYEFSQIIPWGENLVLRGHRTEFHQHYDEARVFQGGWVVTQAGKYPIEVELKRVRDITGEG